MNELIKRLERVIATGAPNKDGMHLISAEAMLEVVKQLSEHSTNLASLGTDCISRQAAIDAILHITNCKSVRELFEYNQEHHLTEMWSGGVNDAIDAVIGVESATDTNVATKVGTNLAEAGTDCISRQAAIKATWQDTGYTDPFNVMTAIRDRIQQLPPAQPERIRGRWTRDNACSECGCQPWFSGDIRNYNFCPNCGAKMEARNE